MKFLKYISYQQQTLLGLALGIMGLFLARYLGLALLSKLGWSCYALLFIINPIVPPAYKPTPKDHKQIQWAAGFFLGLIWILPF